jgi:hypothetical protein
LKFFVKNAQKCFRSRAALFLGGLALVCFAGCSSPDARFPYNALRLDEVRQSSTGQLALIYNTAPERTPGQRVFLVDESALNRNVITAVNDLRESPGHAEAFSGGLILHRNLSLTQPGPEKYWVQLDPFALTGTWTPPLDQPPLPLGAAIAALPASFFPTQTLVSGNEDFMWQTVEGPLDTTVSGTPLFQPNRRDTLSGKTEAVLGGTTIAVGTVAVVGAFLTLEYLCHSSFDYPLSP